MTNYQYEQIKLKKIPCSAFREFCKMEGYKHSDAIEPLIQAYYAVKYLYVALEYIQGQEYLRKQ